MEGYIKLHRQIENWEWYQDIPVKVLFLHLLLEVNHADRKWQGITIHRGQTITSVNKLALDTGLSVQNVRTALKKLTSTSEITCTSTNRYTLINVENYGKYQGEAVEVNTQTNTPTNKQVTNDQQTTNNKQEYKEYKNKEYINIVEQVVGYLNHITGKNYSSKSDSNRKLVIARLNDGYKADDFKKVIDNKYTEWKDTKYETYLRPSTLFSKSHFDDYLNSTPRKRESSNPFLNILENMA